jgi:hypothetical protein
LKWSAAAVESYCAVEVAASIITVRVEVAVLPAFPRLPTPKTLLLRTLSRDSPMLTFEIIGGIFILLFLAAAMTGIEGAEGR